MNTLRAVSLLAVLTTFAGCATTYGLITPGTIHVEGLELDTATSWNLAPRTRSSASRPNSQTWTQDGLLLDRLIIVPGVADGETVFVSRRDDAALPVFRAGMLPNEIEELAESSLVKLFGEGRAVVGTRDLRPHRYGDDRGILFNLEVAVSDGPDYKGLAGSFVAGGSLYLMIFLGADPYYYDKHLAEAEAVITSARLAPAS